MPYSIWNSNRSGAMPRSAAKRARRGDHRRVVRGDRRDTCPRVSSTCIIRRTPRRRRPSSDRRRLRLLVGALHQPHARAERVHPRHVVLAALQVRLQHDADVAIALLPQRLEDVERTCGVAASSPCRCARRSRALPAPSRIRRRLSTQVARSTSGRAGSASARCCGRCRPRRSGSMQREVLARRRDPPPRAWRRSRRGSRASAAGPRLDAARAASIASSIVSPAMKRRAKLCGRACRSATRGLQRSGCRRARGRTPSRRARASVRAGRASRPASRCSIVRA